LASTVRWHDVPDAKRLKALEVENQRLKKLLAERDLDIECLRSPQKDGDRAGTAAGGTFRPRARTVGPSRVLAAARGAV
jgi:hypothetical protein